MYKPKINVIAFDADDTLWVNEPFFHKTTTKLCAMLSNYRNPEAVGKQLEEIQSRNLQIFGYGIKGFTISMMETALEVSQGQIDGDTLKNIIDMGKEMQTHPVKLLHGVENTLQQLHSHFKLMLITKGDLIEQERKLHQSGLSNYFQYVEIVSEKNETLYEKLLTKHDIAHDQFLMVGNSIKSDILPVINIGSHAFHIPFHTTWILEQVNQQDIQDQKIITLKYAHELLDILLPPSVSQ
ncbi:HAD family hydrolase [Maridesulfovibrio ferrireducens]|uniref:HAD family hydrolase n=1 Tax=Maridesulfovibrio ferrireducens TaxID=246191 RepID=UPI001A33D8D5|nr:HAD family hydrolase [Maridesulfovibrio ferrireducens]MBI9109836.1 HAD family hydrolase [Maridesulfovibrio ferrireducens]